jgi:hypothetical protein
MSITFYAGKQVGDSIEWVFTKDELADRNYTDPMDPDDEGTPNPAYRPELDVNLSNRNAAYVLAELGIELDDGYFSIPINDLLIRCTNLLRGSLKYKRQGIRTTVQAEPGHPTIIDMGIEEGYVERQVMRISVLAREGKARGAEYIYGC